MSYSVIELMSRWTYSLECSGTFSSNPLDYRLPYVFAVKYMWLAKSLKQKEFYILAKINLAHNNHMSK